MIDVVSGSIVYSMSHRKAREPLHIVHSENWLVYSYYNDKVRRTELSEYLGLAKALYLLEIGLDRERLNILL